MKLQHLGLGCLLASAAWGCASYGAGKTYRPTTYPPLDTRGAYPATRLIGIKSDPKARCPKIPGWLERPLFRPSRDGGVCLPGEYSDGALIAVERKMDAFCLYEAGWGPRAIPQPEALGLVRLEPDAVAMTAAVQIPGKSGPLGRSLGPALENHFTQQVGGGLPGRRETPSVRLAFLDSEPVNEDATSGKKNPHMEHGHFLRLLGARLAGPKVEITTRLALPIVKFDAERPEGSVREDTGGFIGSFADLAEAIDEEVADWERSGPKHLVLNLSVGWDGTRFGGLAETRECDLPPGPRAVYLALERAARKGVLIFAAAGNSQSGPNATSGPLLPAAWMRGNVKAESSCGDELEGPLLYAVGGLQANDQPIANARRGGMPDLAAYADHVALTDPNGKVLTSTYTGTSVATAVVSSLAAKIWAEEGGDKASAVHSLKEQGHPLPYDADFAFRSPGPVLRIGGCDRSDASCPKGPLQIDLGAPKGPFLAAPKLAEGCPAAAKESAYPALRLCPNQTLDDRWLFAWVVPQPESDPCPSCAMGPPRRYRLETGMTEGFLLRAEIAEEWLKPDVHEVLTTATVEAVSEEGAKTYFTFDVPKEYRTQRQFDIVLTGAAPMTPQPVKATVTWVVRSGAKISSINSPVLILK